MESILSMPAMNGISLQSENFRMKNNMTDIFSLRMVLECFACSTMSSWKHWRKKKGMTKNV